MDLDKYFKKAELIPAIVTDIDTGAVLMLAYMNKMCIRDRLSPTPTHRQAYLKALIR